MTQEKRFAQIFKENRNKNNFSFRVLGKKLGVTAGNLFQYEKGKTYPSASVLDKICSLFGLNFDHIYSLIQKEKMAPEAKRLMPNYAYCSTVKEVREISGMTFFAGAGLPKPKHSTDKDFERILVAVHFKIIGDFIEPVAKSGQRILVEFASSSDPIRLGSIVLLQLNIHNKTLAKRYCEFTGDKILPFPQTFTDDEYLKDGTVKEHHIVIIGKIIMIKDEVIKLRNEKYPNKSIWLNKEKDIANIAYILGVLF